MTPLSNGATARFHRATTAAASRREGRLAIPPQRDGALSCAKLKVTWYEYFKTPPDTTAHISPGPSTSIRFILSTTTHTSTNRLPPLLSRCCVALL